MRLARRLLLPALFCSAWLPAQKDILLITLDTVRADHLSCYGYAQKTSPAMDAFAKEAVRFTRCYAPAPYTLPAHATVLTGLWPKDHGMRDNVGPPLVSTAVTLTSLLKDAGYRTAAFVSSFVLDRRFGLDRGFDRYDDRMTVLVSEDRERNERPAEETEKDVLSYLAALPEGGRVFLWVHLYDPHYPYVRHAGSPAGMSDYDGEILHMDRSVGRILEAWRARRRGLVLVTADHGESLGEHGEHYHGMFLYESCVRVPLLLHVDGRSTSGKDDRLAGLTDIAPTLLGFAGISPPGGPGLSLLARAPLHDRFFFESFIPANSFGWIPPFAIVKDGYKYIHLPKPELYDLVRDPSEKKNLMDALRPKARSLKTFLEEGYGTTYVPPEGAPDAETVRRLESLGYRGGSTARFWRDPKDLIWVVGELYFAKQMMREGRFDEAQAAYRKVLAADPDNIPAQVEFSDLCKAMGRVEDARSILQGALRSNPRYAYALLNLAILDLETGDPVKARGEFEAFHQMVPTHAGALYSLFLIALAAGETGAAAGYLDKAARVDPSSAQLHFGLGLLAEAWKDPQAAEAEFVRCLEIQPDHFEALTGRAKALFQTGKVDESIQAYRNSLALNPDQPPVYLALGAILLNVEDDPGAARKVFHAFLERFPDHPEAAGVREVVQGLSEPLQ